MALKRHPDNYKHIIQQQVVMFMEGCSGSQKKYNKCLKIQQICTAIKAKSRESGSVRPL
ncbi:hypothetical protein EXN66_Car019480 [Channa argus]|uniref:Uncharacterized protein n=1 Tax=Channa argus TaxID=215402 RepID=A0A6G1QMI9_CHAAH|nr:hypothetical protein EXN66_Car019480 [Channa argus]